MARKIYNADEISEIEAIARRLGELGLQGSVTALLSFTAGELRAFPWRYVADAPMLVADLEAAVASLGWLKFNAESSRIYAQPITMLPLSVQFGEMYQPAFRRVKGTEELPDVLRGAFSPFSELINVRCEPEVGSPYLRGVYHRDALICLIGRR